MNNREEVVKRIQAILDDYNASEKVNILASLLGGNYLLHLRVTGQEKDEETKKKISEYVFNFLQHYEDRLNAAREAASVKD